MAAFACVMCRQHIQNRYDRLEARLELRRVSDLGRHRVVKVADLCKACAHLLLGRVESGEVGVEDLAQGRLLL